MQTWPRTVGPLAFPSFMAQTKRLRGGGIRIAGFEPSGRQARQPPPPRQRSPALLLWRYGRQGTTPAAWLLLMRPAPWGPGTHSCFPLFSFIPITFVFLTFHMKIFVVHLEDFAFSQRVLKIKRHTLCSLKHLESSKNSTESLYFVCVRACVLCFAFVFFCV